MSKARYLAGLLSATGDVNLDNLGNAPSGIPPQAGNAGEYLKTDGTTATWESVAAGGTAGTTIAMAIVFG